MSSRGRAAYGSVRRAGADSARSVSEVPVAGVNGPDLATPPWGTAGPAEGPGGALSETVFSDVTGARGTSNLGSLQTYLRSAKILHEAMQLALVEKRTYRRNVKTLPRSKTANPENSESGTGNQGQAPRDTRSPCDQSNRSNVKPATRLTNISAIMRHIPPILCGHRYRPSTNIERN